MYDKTSDDFTQKLNSSFTLYDNKPTVASDKTHASIEAVDVFKYLALVLISLLNILGNTSVCIVVAKNRRLRDAVRNQAIASLACSDLTMVPFFLYKLAKLSNRTFHDACVFFASFLIMSLYTSILHLFVLCVDTYVAVFYPLRYRMIITRKRITCALLLVWVLPTLNVFVLPLSIDEFQASEYRSRLFTCGYHSGPQPPPTQLYLIHSLATGTIFGALPFVVILVAYARIAKTAWYQASRDRADVAGNNNSRTRTNIRRMRELKWAKTVVIVIGAFLCSYVPLFLVSAVALRLPGGSNKVIEKLVTAFAYLAYTNTCLNSLIYSFRSSEYRTGLKKIFCRLKCRFWDERERRPRPSRACSTTDTRQRVKCCTTNGSSSKDSLDISCSSSSPGDEVSQINEREVDSKM